MKKPKLIITELFLVKADWKRTFYGQIRRDITDEGEPVIYGTVNINGKKVWSLAGDQRKLGKYLDDACILILEGTLDKVIEKNKVKTLMAICPN